MPLYEYLCEDNHRTTRTKSIKTPVFDLDFDVCDCGKPSELTPSKPGRPILVGQGFHQNDYQHGKLGT